MAAHNKQLERTVMRRHVRAACASLHCAHAARWTRRHAAAQLRRYAPDMNTRAVARMSARTQAKRRHSHE